MEFKGYKRYFGSLLLDAQTPIDRTGECWCVDSTGRGAFYDASKLTLTPTR